MNTLHTSTAMIKFAMGTILNVTFKLQTLKQTSWPVHKKFLS